MDRCAMNVAPEMYRAIAGCATVGSEPDQSVLQSVHLLAPRRSLPAVVLQITWAIPGAGFVQPFAVSPGTGPHRGSRLKTESALYKRRRARYLWQECAPEHRKSAHEEHSGSDSACAAN